VLIAFQWLSVGDSMSGIDQSLRQLVQVPHQQAGVRFPRRPEILLHAKMDSDFVFLKPHSTTLREFGWLPDFRNTKQIGIKAPRLVFSAGGHGELDMMDAGNRIVAHTCILTDRRRHRGCVKMSNQFPSRNDVWDNSPTLRKTNFSRAIFSAFVALALLVCAVSARQFAQERPSHPIAIIGIPNEIAPVEARLNAAAMTRIQDVVFNSGVIDGASIVAVRSGAGKVNAAIAATLLLDHFSPSAVVFTGTAGAVDPELNPGDVVIATAVGYHDFGDVTTAGFVRSATRNASSGRLDPVFFPADSRLLAAARRAAVTLKLSPAAKAGPMGRIREGLIVTGDSFVANPGSREDLRRQLNATAVEMEGAAVAQVCARFGVPVIVIRSITDHADGGAAGSYREFREVASRNAADLTLATIHEMLK
jgi:adenosylhomocysteine nucleosidase